jgi:hypothetical protein
MDHVAAAYAPMEGQGIYGPPAWPGALRFDGSGLSGLFISGNRQQSGLEENDPGGVQSPIGGYEIRSGLSLRGRNTTNARRGL